MESMTLFRRQAANPGSNRDASNSASTLVSTLIPVLVVAVVSVVLFLVLRKKFQKVYQPRTHDGILYNEGRRTPGGKGFFATIADVKGLPDYFVLEHNSLDGYLYLRFFKLLIVISFVGCCITWPILFPVNATGGGTSTQLDRISFSNVVDVKRYYAHAVVAWIFLGFVTLAIARERMNFIGLRQAYFLTSVRATRLTSRTVLFMGIPKDQQTEHALKAALGRDVRNVWFATDCKDLDDSVEERDKAALKLEGAEVKLSKQANAARIKSEKKGSAGHTADQRDPNHWINNKKRPTHKLKPLIGKKVDTINWSHQELPRMSKKVAEEQHKHQAGNAKFGSSAFVEFTSQAAAQRAYQLAAKSKKKTMQPRYIDVQPDEIIWKNLGNSYATRKVKLAIATAIVVCIIIFWTPIIAFVGALTNINSLTEKAPFLSFINKVPSVILGVITGLLPTIVLAVCVMLVPIICRLLAKMGGEPTLSAVELKTQTWYFAFQVVQVFLMTTFISGATAVTQQIINNPSSATTLLAENLPKASNFYISYFILYGLAQAASQLLNIVALALYVVLGKFLDKTPRKMYKRWMSLAGIGWGSEYPKWTNLGVIALSYSCIAPLVLGFATLGFTLLYLAFRYKWLFVLGNKVDMKGEAYARALKQLMTGVYLSTVCLLGLFAIGVSRTTAATGPLVLMIVFLVVVIIFQIVLNSALGPLEQGLPLDLVSNDAYDYDVSEHKIGAMDDQGYHKEDNSLRPSDVTGTTTAADVEAAQDAYHTHPDGKTGNKLTQRLRPYIDQHFYAPNKNLRFELPEINYTPRGAYYNPAITSEPPFIWLARDPCGVSNMLVRDNEAAGIRSSDDFAWFDEKNKLQWSNKDVHKVRNMLNELNTMSGTQEERAQQPRMDQLRE